MPDARTHVGVDLAWGPKNRTGLAVVAADGRLLASASARGDDEIVDWIGAHAPQLGVVAIDAPLVVTNETGQRPCETEIGRAFSRFDASAHSSNLSKPQFNPPRGAAIAERLGVPIDGQRGRSGVAIEVYPHPAMVGLWQLDRILKYKRSSPLGLRMQEFGRLLQALEGVPELRLDASETWASVRNRAAGAGTQAALNLLEDEVDAVVCAWIAWKWAQDDGSLELYGDNRTGFIVAPPRPAHAHRARVREATPVLTDYMLSGPDGTHGLTRAEAHHLSRMLRQYRDTVKP